MESLRKFPEAFFKSDKICCSILLSMAESPETETVADFPAEPTVVRELDRLYCVGMRYGEDDEVSYDGTLTSLSPPEDEGIGGFTSGVIPGASVRFYVTQIGGANCTGGEDRSQEHLDTTPVETIELMSDGSYRITTVQKGFHTVHRLTGTHSRNGKVINDSAAAGPIEEEGRRTIQTLDGLLGHRRES